jgi:hypothetical protein
VVDIRWVGDIGGNTCWVAALAMVTGQGFEAVQAGVSPEIKSGADYFVEDSYLEAHGYAVARRFNSVPHLNERERVEWPPAPWADVHLCGVIKHGSPHAVVMLADGTVLDPNTPQTYRLSDYDSVYTVAAVVKVK